jgi:hypothetical protein
VDPIPRHVATRSIPQLPCGNLNSRHQLHDTGTASGDAPVYNNNSALFSHENTILLSYLYRCRGNLAYPGLRHEPQYFGTAGRQQAPFPDTSLNPTGRGFTTTIFLRPSPGQSSGTTTSLFEVLIETPHSVLTLDLPSYYSLTTPSSERLMSLIQSSAIAI